MANVLGVTNASGVRVTEIRQNQNQIRPTEVGYIGLLGVTEKGPTDKVRIVSSLKEYNDIYGGFVEGFETPSVSEDFFDVAGGAGGIAVLRITDGNEVAASSDLYARRDLQTKIGTISAKNGGRWGGKFLRFVSDVANTSDITATTLTLDSGDQATFVTNELVGAKLKLSGVPNKSYKIVSNTASEITVVSDATMKFDLDNAGDSSNTGFAIELDNDGKAVSYIIGDGQIDPDNNFSLRILVDGNQVLVYNELSVDPTSKYYFVDVINKDPQNEFVSVSKTFTGEYNASARPANLYGKITNVTASVLTFNGYDTDVESPGGADPTFTIGTLSSGMVEQNITLTMTSTTQADVNSDVFGVLGTLNEGALFAAPNDYTPSIQIDNGGTALASGDVLKIRLTPLKENALAGGTLYPDKLNAPNVGFEIEANTVNTITVVSGSDLTDDGAIGDNFLAEFAVELKGGRDGNQVVDADYESALVTSTSLFNALENENLGFIRMSVPGVSSTSVTKKLVAYCDANDYLSVPEVPKSIKSASAVKTWVNSTIGRSDYFNALHTTTGTMVSRDPEKRRANVRVSRSILGVFHGRQSAIYGEYNGYYKVASGVSATLDGVLELDWDVSPNDAEQIQPVGITPIRRVGGNFVIFGAQLPSTNDDKEFVNKMQTMSNYKHILLRNFDATLFELNNQKTDLQLALAIDAFFRQEYTKGAIVAGENSGFRTGQEPACIIKVDSENNTAASRARGEKNATVIVNIVDTTNQVRFEIGQRGIEAVAQ